MTPIEEYQIHGSLVFVKRDDLCAQPPLPPIAKARGLEALLERLLTEDINRVAVYEAPASLVGWLVAASCIPFGIEAHVFYPTTSRRKYTRSVQIAQKYGAILHPLRSNVTHVCYSQAKNFARNLGAFMIPFGFDMSENIQSLKREVAALPKHSYSGGTVIVPTGSGVTAGVIASVMEEATVIAVSTGRSASSIRKVLEKHAGEKAKNIKLVSAETGYGSPIDIACPFPCDPFCDRKAWYFLMNSLKTLIPPLLFWNIGGLASEERCLG